MSETHTLTFFDSFSEMHLITFGGKDFELSEVRQLKLIKIRLNIIDKYF